MSSQTIIKKKWLGFIKTEAQKSGWKFKQYFIFKIDGAFLFSAMFWVNGNTNSLTGVLSFKHKEIDELFWELTDNLNLIDHPLSLKVEGSYIVFPISYYKFSIPDITEKDILILLQNINDRVEEIKELYTDKEKYYSYIKEEKRFNEYGYLTNLLYLKKYKELLNFIDHCKQNNIVSGVNFYKGDILEATYFDRINDYVMKNNLIEKDE